MLRYVNWRCCYFTSWQFLSVTVPQFFKSEVQGQNTFLLSHKEISQDTCQLWETHVLGCHTVLRWWLCHGLQSLSCLFCPYLTHQEKTLVRTPDFHLMRPNVAGMKSYHISSLHGESFFIILHVSKETVLPIWIQLFYTSQKTWKKWKLTGSQKHIQYNPKEKDN